MENRRWRNAELERVLAELEEQHNELKWIRHVRGCGNCQIELQLAIERYGGRNCPWYLNLEYETGWYPDVYQEDSLYKNAPRLDRYKIGSYWNGTSSDTIRFILDRVKWAEAIIQKFAETLVDYCVEVEEWDLDSELPAKPMLFLPETYS